MSGPGLLVVNFGGPSEASELEPFLANLLADVLPSWLKPFAPWIARRRAIEVRPRYEAIGYSPLVADTFKQVDGLRDRLGADAPPIAVAMMFTQPTLRDGVQHLLDQACDSIVVLGLFPHWSFATSGAAYDMVHHALVSLGKADFPVHYARAFFSHPAYIEALASTIRDTHAAITTPGPTTLLFSPHGVPVSFIKRGDPYPDHVRESVRHTIEALGWRDPWRLGWQSRLGPARWLTPDVRDVIRELGVERAGNVLLVPISFVGEHIETLDEIDRELAELAHNNGLNFYRAPALGQTPAFLDALADITRTTLARFGSTHCSRCLIPVPGTQRREGVCKNCGFERPIHLRDGTGGVA